jgi:hypothetical protein
MNALKECSFSPAIFKANLLAIEEGLEPFLKVVKGKAKHSFGPLGYLKSKNCKKGFLTD